MKNFIFLFFFAFIGIHVSAQNVGQAGDTLLNYVDINGLKQGVWKKNYSNGNPQYEAYFINDKPIGDFFRYDKKGFLAVHMKYDATGDFARAIFYHSNAKPAGVGNYIGKNKDSIWNYYNDAGILFLQESFKNGIKHGVFRQYTSKKILIEETHWKNGVQEGSWKKYFATGEPMWESNYVNGKLEGTAISYYKSGKRYREGVFRNDLMEGPWKKYNENGNLEKIYQYKKGVSPEAENEKDALMKDLYEHKDQIDGPANSNDINWLRGKQR